MRSFNEFMSSKDKVIAENMAIDDIKNKVYDAINAKNDNDENIESDDVWNQQLSIFDDKDRILEDADLAQMINSHPDRGSILRSIDTGKITVGALIRKIGDRYTEPPELEPSRPNMASQGPTEPGHNPVPIA